MKNKKIKQIERPESLCDIAVRSIRDAIIDGTYELGETLSESVLSKTLGISKTPIREALSVLKQEGLVTTIPQKGTFVFTMSVDEVVQLSLYRYSLETTAIEMATEKHPEKLATELVKISDKMAVAQKHNDVSEYLSLDSSYHDAFFKHCDNKYLIDGYRLISGKISALRTHLSQHPSHTDKSFEEHQQIASLLKEGNLQEVKTILLRHVTRGERTYAEGIEDIAAASKQQR